MSYNYISGCISINISYSRAQNATAFYCVLVM